MTGILLSTPSEPVQRQWSLWAWLQTQVDAALYRPCAAPGIVAHKLVERGGIYYVLKNPAQGTYLKLAEADYEMWQLMDGSRTVKDLVVAYFVRHKAFAIGRVAAFVDELKAGYFLTDQPVGVYRQAREQLTRRDWTYRWRRLAEAFLEYIFFLDGLDGFFGALYRLTRWLFTWPAQVILALIAVAGFIAFAALLTSHRYAILVTSGSYWLGFLILLLANSVILFIHEFSHALTTKHYGRELCRGGFMVYYGMPAFFVDTTDMWLEPKAHRIAVAWAGPYSGLVVGGLSSLLALLLPDALAGQLLFKTAFIGYFLFFINLNPLLELDGYLLLIDWLEMPMLRQRSFEFIRREWWEKTTRKQADNGARGKLNAAALSREEIIFTIFGAASAAYTIYSVVVAIYFWQTRLVRVLADLWNRQGWVARLAVMAGGGAVLVPLALILIATAWSTGKRLAGWLEERHFFDSHRNIILALAGLTALLILAPAVLYDPWWTVYLALAPAALLGIAVASLVATAFQYEGAEFQRVFWALAGTVALLLIAQSAHSLALVAGVRDGPLAVAISVLASSSALPLVLAGLWSLWGVDLRQSSSWELTGMAALVTLGFLVVIPLVRWSASMLAIAAPYLVVVFIAAILPTLIAYARTRFFVPWLILASAAIATGVCVMLRASPGWPAGGDIDLWLDVLTAGLWALGGAAYTAASWRLRFEPSHWSQDLMLSDKEQLCAAFARFLQAMATAFRATFGARRAQSVEDKIDVLAAAADWDIEIQSGQVRDELDLGQITILDQADRYREVLGRAIDLMDNWSGSQFIARAAQAAYDSLPWPERQVLGQYVLTGTSWGGAIARDFAAVRGERERLIRGVPILAGCSDRAFALIQAAIRPQAVPAYTTLARQGAPVDRFVIVQSGSVEKWTQDSPGAPARLAGTLHRGASFGAEVFIGGKFSGTYRAGMDTELLVIASAEAAHLMRAGVKLASRVGEALSVTQLLGRMPMFANLGPQQLGALAQHLGRQTVTPGQVVVRQDEPRHHFYIVAQGEVELSARDANGTEQPIKRLGAGEHFGETALFADVPYTATVRAVQPTVLLTLDEPTFDKMVAGSARMTHYVEQVSSGRMIEERRRLATEH